MTDTELQQLGKFRISRTEIIREPLTNLMIVMSHFVVVRAEVMFDSNTIVYVAISHLFDPVPEGDSAPWYDLFINDLDAGNITVTATRSDSRGYGGADTRSLDEDEAGG